MQRGGCTCCTCLYLPSCSACTWACTCACTRAVLVPMQCCTCACTRPLLMPPCHRRPRGPPIGNKHPNARTWLTSGAGASEKMQEKCMHACAIGKLEAAAGLHQGLQCCTGCTACTCPVLAPGTWQAWVLHQGGGHRSVSSREAQMPWN